MNKFDLIRLLSSYEENEVLILMDGRACDISFDVEQLPESFDGFATAYPAAVVLKVLEEE